MTRARALAAGWAASLLSAPGTAEAHLVGVRFGDFYAGAIHPVTALEHALPWLAMGVLAAMQGPERGRWVVPAFPLGLAVGTALALVVHQEPVVSVLNVASFVILGGLIAAAWPLPAPVLAGIALLTGLTHGYENGTAMTLETDRLLFVSGVAGVGYVLVTLVTAVTVGFLRNSAAWRRIGLRALGSWIAAVGIMLLGFRLMVR